MEKPKLLLLGNRRYLSIERSSGKSSIEKVVFQNMPPNDTLFLESTQKAFKNDISSFIDYQIWDFPGHIQFHDVDPQLFLNCKCLIFVIDAQDDIVEALQRLYNCVVEASKYNIEIAFEVFIHKVDGLSDDSKIEIQREVSNRISEELEESGLGNIHLSFHLTSIYDHSIFEAFSKVIQKLVTNLPNLENLLNILCTNSAIEKVFLFDAAARFYIATDSSPVDTQTYELCADMITLIQDLSTIYNPSATKPIKEDSDFLTVMELDNDILLYFCYVNPQLALVSIIRNEHVEKQGLIEYNFHVACGGILQVLGIAEK